MDLLKSRPSGSGPVGSKSGETAPSVGHKQEIQAIDEKEEAGQEVLALILGVNQNC